jgi:hypothetical protein
LIVVINKPEDSVTISGSAEELRKLTYYAYMWSHSGAGVKKGYDLADPEQEALWSSQAEEYRKLTNSI